MIVDSLNMEFGHEMFAAIPYAYYHYKNGTLEGTRSARGTAPFYYFSPRHVINHDPRYSGNVWRSTIPSVQVKQFTGEGEWEAPPYKLKYANRRFVYDKPILVISNKYNREWNGPPVNFLNIDTLDKIISMCRDKYKIFYNRKLPYQLVDDQMQLDLFEHEFIKDVYPDVEFVHELPGDYNLNQLRLYANCDRFISVQGGGSVLASYFGGINLVYVVKGKETKCGFYERLNKLSGCEVARVSTYSNLLNMVSKIY